MKIILLAELAKPVGPDGGGGVNKIVYYLAEGLTKRNHEVIVLASGDSKTSARLIPMIDRGLDEIIIDKKVKDILKIKALTYLQDLISTDKQTIIHNHLVWRYTALSDNFITPTVTTLHNNPLSAYANQIYSNHNNHCYISISNNQKKIVEQAGVKVFKTIYNGIPTNLYTFTEIDADSLFYLGRISKGKGLDEVIEIADRFGKTLNLAGDKDDAEIDYWESIEKKIKNNPRINRLGQLTIAEKNQIISKSKFFLFPTQWEEPFGLVSVESMACGTPVIAYTRGSVPEIVEDGVTGFLVNQSNDYIRGNWIVKKTGLEGLIEAAKLIYSMSKEDYQKMRINCRKHVENNFTVDRMVDEYESVYQQILNQ